MSNQFQGVGNLGSKPELKQVERNGELQPVLDLRIYFDRRVPTGSDDAYEDRGGFWISAALWGARAERAAGVLDKGMRVFVTGTLISETWRDPDSAELRSDMKLRLNYLAVDLSRVEAIQMAARQRHTDTE